MHATFFMVVMAMAAASAIGSPLRKRALGCPAQDDDGNALIRAIPAPDFTACSYPSGSCSFFTSGGTFSSGSSTCPSGLVEGGSLETAPSTPQTTTSDSDTDTTSVVETEPTADPTVADTTSEVTTPTTSTSEVLPTTTSSTSVASTPTPAPTLNTATANNAPPANTSTPTATSTKGNSATSQSASWLITLFTVCVVGCLTL